MAEDALLSFTEAEYRRLETAIGRRDAPAHRYLRDLERLGRGYRALVVGGAMGQDMPPSVRRDLRQFVDSVIAVSTPLYRLPEDLRALLTLQLVSETTSRRAQTDLDAILRPLEDLAGIARRLLAGEFEGESSADADPALVLLRAAARAYRNAFNIPVELAGLVRFRASVELLLESLAERGVTEAVALRVGLDEALDEALAPRPPAFATGRRGRSSLSD